MDDRACAVIRVKTHAVGADALDDDVRGNDPGDRSWDVNKAEQELAGFPVRPELAANGFTLQAQALYPLGGLVLLKPRASTTALPPAGIRLEL